VDAGRGRKKPRCRAARARDLPDVLQNFRREFAWVPRARCPAPRPRRAYRQPRVARRLLRGLQLSAAVKLAPRSHCRADVGIERSGTAR